MFCDHCGTQLEGSANFCATCGRSFAPQSVPVRRSRVAGHIRILAILWLVRAGLRLLSALFLTSLFNYGWGFGEGMPGFVPGIVRGISIFLLAGALLGGIAGWGLLERRPWARMLAMVMGVLALFDLPFGTALGIYTLWVLAPASSEIEYRSLARPV